MLGQRKGFLLAEETLKIVIALIAITFLIYFLVSLYFAKINSAKQEQANRILLESQESLKKTIEGLNENGNREFLLDSPKGWNFLTFTGNEKPNSCPGEKCACICNNPAITTQIKKCEEVNNGVCIAIQNLQPSDLTIKIDENLQKIYLAKQNGVILISRNPIAIKTATASSGTSKTAEKKDEGFVAVVGNFLKTISGKVRILFGGGDAQTKGGTPVGGVKGQKENTGAEQT